MRSDFAAIGTEVELFRRSALTLAVLAMIVVPQAGRAEEPTNAPAVESAASSPKEILVAGIAENRSADDAVLYAGRGAGLGIEGAAMAPQAAGTGGSAPAVAGKVTREVPQGTLEHQSKVTPLLLNDPVGWNDTVHTQNKGRLQITLMDGSVLSVGSRSEMKVVKSDAETQQTDIQLVTGTVRADVQKFTKRGGHFEIHTKTAVIGVVN
jgi:hypothetical protein